MKNDFFFFFFHQEKKGRLRQALSKTYQKPCKRACQNLFLSNFFSCPPHVKILKGEREKESK